MPKPSLSALWDTAGTNTTALLSGHVTDGFVTDEIPGSAELNQWMQIVGQHCDYLQTGDLELTGLTLPWSSVVLTNATQTITPASGVLVTYLTGGGAAAAIKGIVADHDRRVVVLVNTTGSDVALIAEDSSAIPYYLVLNDAAIGASLRLPDGAAVAFRFDGANGQWNVIWSSCPLAPTTRTIPIDISKGQIRNSGTGTLTLSGSVRYLQASAGPTSWQFPVEIPVGATITEVVVGYNRNAAASVAFELDRWNMAGSETVVASHVDTTSSGDTTAVFSGFSGSLLPFVTLANETLCVTVSPDTNGRIYALTVTFKPPV